jgi:CheY-like chemotaxis protein
MAKKILIVDDDVDIVEMLKTLLEAEGYEIVEAFDGKEALDKVHIHKPDFILLDIMMPVMDGWEVAKRLKACKKTFHIPIAILTAKISPEDKKKAFCVGAEDYLTKPFHPDELIQRIENLIVKDEGEGMGLFMLA